MIIECTICLQKHEHGLRHDRSGKLEPVKSNDCNFLVDDEEKKENGVVSRSASSAWK